MLVGSVVLRGIFGKTLGSAFTGAGAGLLVYLGGYALALAGVAAVGAFLITLLMGFAGAGSGWSGGGAAVSAAAGAAWAAALAAEVAASAEVAVASAAAVPRVAGRGSARRNCGRLLHQSYHARNTRRHFPPAVLAPSSRPSGLRGSARRGSPLRGRDRLASAGAVARSVPAAAGAAGVRPVSHLGYAHNNGVLVYVLCADHAVEIVADRGISAARSPGGMAGRVPRDGEPLSRRALQRRLGGAASSGSAPCLGAIFPGLAAATTNCPISRTPVAHCRQSDARAHLSLSKPR